MAAELTTLPAEFYFNGRLEHAPRVELACAPG
jgi:hypothetical protein